MEPLADGPVMLPEYRLCVFEGLLFCIGDQSSNIDSQIAGNPLPILINLL